MYITERMKGIMNEAEDDIDGTLLGDLIYDNKGNPIYVQDKDGKFYSVSRDDVAKIDRHTVPGKSYDTGKKVRLTMHKLQGVYQAPGGKKLN